MCSLVGGCIGDAWLVWFNVLHSLEEMARRSCQVKLPDRSDFRLVVRIEDNGGG
jgi:hypothetical protein